MQTGNKKLGIQGSKIMTEAKRIRKENPNLKWTECVKQAAKNLKKDKGFQNPEKKE